MGLAKSTAWGSASTSTAWGSAPKSTTWGSAPLVEPSVAQDAKAIAMVSWLGDKGQLIAAGIPPLISIAVPQRTLSSVSADQARLLLMSCRCLTHFPDELSLLTIEYIGPYGMLTLAHRPPGALDYYKAGVVVVQS